MKAVLLKSSDAAAIRDGKTSRIVKLWTTPHRGPLLIVATDGPHLGGFLRGCTSCIVDLVDTRPARDAANLAERADAVAWMVDRPRRVAEAPIIGGLCLFEVSDEQISQPPLYAAGKSEVPSAAPAPAPSPPAPRPAGGLPDAAAAPPPRSKPARAKKPPAPVEAGLFG